MHSKSEKEVNAITLIWYHSYLHFDAIFRILYDTGYGKFTLPHSTCRQQHRHSVFLFDIYLFMAHSVNMKWTLHTLHYYVWAISSFRCTFKYDCFRLKIIANMFVHHSNIYYGIEDLIKWKIAKFTIVLNWLQRQLGWKVFIIVVCWLWKALKLFIQRKKIFQINFSF